MTITVYEQTVTIEEISNIDLEADFVSQFEPKDYDVPEDTNHVPLGRFKIIIEWESGFDFAA